MADEVAPDRARLADFARRVLASHPNVESAIGAPAKSEAVDKVLAGDDHALTRVEWQHVEAIVSDRCPTYEIADDQLAAAPTSGPWARLAADQAWLRAVIRAAGRLDCPGLDAGYAGTGFLVGPGLALTNRHVALLFARGLGAANIEITEATEIDHKREQKAPRDRDFAAVTGVRMIHPYWDVAIVSVGAKEGRAPVTLASAPPAGGARAIAVIGYPAVASAAYLYDDAVVAANFGADRGSWKRLQPGMTAGFGEWQPSDPAFPKVTALKHEASTLAGNSGSLVVDLETKQVVGVHFAGIEHEANYCVPTWELYADERVRALGLTFAARGGDAPKANADVEKAWDAIGGKVRVAVPASAPVGVAQSGTAQMSAAQTSALPSNTNANESPPSHAAAPAARAGDWYERIGAEDLAALLAAPDGPAQLRAAIGARQLDALVRAAAEAAAPRDPDPELPEILLVPGLFGSHLDDPRTARRAWLSPRAFAGDSLAADLASPALAASAPLALVYRALATSLRAAGYAVHELAFDWRARLDVAADQLHCAIESRCAARPRRFAIVAHSSGALAACLYAQRHARWQDRVARAILLAPPLAGTYLPVELALGVHPIQTKLAWLGAADLDDVAGALRTAPGLAQLLPDPTVFPDARALYQSATWPARARLPQALLDDARNTKDLVRTSPLLARAAVIAAVSRPTIDRLDASPDRAWQLADRDGGGDGAVPARSAARPGLDLAAVDEDHALLPAHPDAHRAVRALLESGVFPTDLATARDLAARVAAPPAAQFPEAAIGASPSVRLRATLAAALDWRALAWLLASDESTPPPDAEPR